MGQPAYSSPPPGLKTDMSVDLFTQHGAGRLVTSNHVRGETWTLLRRRRGFRSAVSFLDGLERTARLRLELVSRDLERTAAAPLERAPGEPAIGRRVRLADATGGPRGSS